MDYKKSGEEITATGSGLSVLINCSYVPHHHWMAFAAWYSIQKYLPDSRAFIHCKRMNGDYRWPLFEWAVKLRAKFSYNRPKDFSGLEIDADTVAVRVWDSRNQLLVPATSPEVATFVTYRDRCGDFVTSEWINSLVAPFNRAGSFWNGRVTVNEHKVLDIWERMLPVYLQIGNVHA